MRSVISQVFIPLHNILLSCVIAVAVLGIALIAMGEDIGTDMSFRTFGHLVSHLVYTDYDITTPLCY